MRTLTLSQSWAASGCSEIAAAWWQRSPTSLSTCSSSVLLVPNKWSCSRKVPAEHFTPCHFIRSWRRCFICGRCLLCECFGWLGVFVLVSAVCSEVTSSSSRSMRKLQLWGGRDLFRPMSLWFNRQPVKHCMYLQRRMSDVVITRRGIEDQVVSVSSSVSMQHFWIQIRLLYFNNQWRS